MSLQKLCFDIIVNNFERYYSVYFHSDDATVKRRFKFLQRKFSYEMASLLYEKGALTDEYIDFLVNRHLKVLDFDWLKDCPDETIVAKFEEAGPGVETLYIRDYYLKSLEDLMRHLPNLQVIKHAYHCTDQILMNLGLFCRNVVEIDIFRSRSVTSEGIKRLCTKEDGQNTGLKLRKLFIGDCWEIDEGIAYLLKNMPLMEDIDYWRLPHTLLSMHVKDFHRIKELEPYNLERLDLIYELKPFPDELLEICSSLCPRLKRLSCMPVMTPRIQKFLCSFSELEELLIQGNVLDYKYVSALLESCGRKLRSLSLFYVSLSDLTLASSCPLLKEMYLNDVDLKIDGGVSPLFASIEKCVFHSIFRLRYKIIGHLVRCSPKLQEVRFGCSMENAAFEAEILTCLEYPIKHIIFSGIVRYVFVRNLLLNWHSLESMTFEDCPFSSEEKIEMEEMAALQPNRPKIVFFSKYVDISTFKRNWKKLVQKKIWYGY